MLLRWGKGLKVKCRGRNLSQFSVSRKNVVGGICRKALCREPPPTTSSTAHPPLHRHTNFCFTQHTHTHTLTSQHKQIMVCFRRPDQKVIVICGTFLSQAPKQDKHTFLRIRSRLELFDTFANNATGEALINPILKQDRTKRSNLPELEFVSNNQ